MEFVTVFFRGFLVPQDRLVEKDEVNLGPEIQSGNLWEKTSARLATRGPAQAGPTELLRGSM